MYEDSLTISLLPALDATLHPETWLFPEMESKPDENGVYVNDVKHFSTGYWKKFYAEVDIAAVGGQVYYEFGYESAPDNSYCRFSPLNEYSHKCNRNNSLDFLRKIIADTFRNSVLPYDRNLSENSRKELAKLMQKLVEVVE